MKSTYKKVALLLTLLLLAMLCTACTAKEQTVAATDQVPVIVSQPEYVLYQNIFYNDYAAQYVGKQIEKLGVFTTVHDVFNDCDRYYVWGVLDNTRCCDWQWELVPADGKTLPANGSVVRVKGVFSASDEALDGYWITDTAIDVQTAYSGAAAAVDMYTMSDTLERVQVINVLYFPEVFEGKQFSTYGRIAGVGLLQDPYYDGSWQIPFSSESDGQTLAIGTGVLLRGTVTDGVLASSTVEKLQE